MRLEGSFYNIDNVSRSGEGYDICVTMAPQHPIYEGHFPGQPVVPGVCTLTIVRECLSGILGRDIRFTSIKECKFISALLPKEGLKLNIHIDIESNKVKCVISNMDALVIKLKAEIQ